MTSPAFRPIDSAMLADVRAGLSLPQKELSPKYFYDRRGSELFEEITRLPEYYLTRAERALLLESWMPSLLAGLHSAALVELGAGSADKTRIVLDAMVAAGSGRVYVPVDVSAEFLEETADTLREEYPTLGIVPAVADIAEEFDLPEILPHPVLYAFLGSTIGNFDPPSAVRLLQRVARAMTPGDRFLLGADLKKDVGRIEAAYNDAQGVTAEFNLNVLRVLNRELGADFDLAGFSHRAFYDRQHDRIEMHLVSAREQDVHIPALGAIRFREGETIRTEISCKYDRERVAAMFGAAGLRIDTWRSDADSTHALVLAAKA